MQSFEEIKEKAGKITHFKVHLFPKPDKKPLVDEDIKYLMEKFHLLGSISTNNLNLLDENMKLKNYYSHLPLHITYFMQYINLIVILLLCSS